MKVGDFLFKHILKIGLVAFTLLLFFPSYSSATTQFTSPYPTVSPEKEWKISFNHAVNPASVSNQTVYATDSAGNTLTNVVSVSTTNEKAVVVKPPANGYKHGQTYTLHIAKSVAMKQHTVSLNDTAGMKFVIEEKNGSKPPSTELDPKPPSTGFGPSYLYQTWKTTYSGIAAKFTFHPDLSLTANAGFIQAAGSYSLNENQLSVQLMGRNKIGEVTVISDKEFTVTDANGSVLRFTR